MGEKLLEALVLLVVGMGGVFLALLFLAGMIWVFKATDEWLNKRRIKRYSQQVESHAVADELNDEVVAVISAAVSIALKKQVVVRRVRFLENRPGGAWATTGRLNIMGSHLVQKRGNQ